MAEIIFSAILFSHRVGYKKDGDGGKDESLSCVCAIALHGAHRAHRAQKVRTVLVGMRTAARRERITVVVASRPEKKCSKKKMVYILVYGENVCRNMCIKINMMLRQFGVPWGRHIPIRDIQHPRSRVPSPQPGKCIGQIGISPGKFYST
ncbi:MAG: hypothetical protein H7833_00500 [Magnetococcus sp. DMHC-1]